MKGKDIKQKGVTINLDKERHVIFDLNAFCELEERFGDINQIFESLSTGSPKSIRAILWAGLIHEDENLTEKEVGKLITFNDLEGTVNKITEGLGASMPEVQEPNIQLGKEEAKNE